MSVYRFLFASLLCCATACGSSSSQPADQGGVDQHKPHSDAGPPPGPTGAAPARFSFQKGTDETSKALTDVLLAFVTTPTKDTAATLEQQRTDALDKLAKDPEGAATKLIDELGALEKAHPTDGNGVLLLINLLGQIESTKGLTFLHDYALRVPPAATKGKDLDARDVVLWMRGVAADQLGRRMTAGSSAAKVHLLDLVEKAEPQVRAIAIRRFYEAMPLRWKAKRQLSQKLKAADQYLLHEIY
jgi:hypothetical protein